MANYRDRRYRDDYDDYYSDKDRSYEQRGDRRDVRRDSRRRDPYDVRYDQRYSRDRDRDYRDNYHDQRYSHHSYPDRFDGYDGPVMSKVKEFLNAIGNRRKVKAIHKKKESTNSIVMDSAVVSGQYLDIYTKK